MRTLIRAVITGFGFSLGKTLFDLVKERYMPEEVKPRVDSDADAEEISEVQPERRPECRPE